MSRARRYYSAASAEQLVGGWVIAAIGALVLAVLAFLALDDPNPPLARVAGLAAFGLVVIGVGVGVARHGRVPLVVDLDTRRVQIPARAAQTPDASMSGSARAPRTDAWSGSVDEAGPLRVIRVTRRFYGGQQVARDRREYRVVLTVDRDWALHQSSDYPKARAVADRLAREWRVSLVQLDGQTLGPHELDAPLWQRPGVVVGVSPISLDPSSGVVVGSAPDRTTFESTVLSRSATAPNILVLAWAVMAALAWSELPVQIDVHGSIAASALYWTLGLTSVATGAEFVRQLVMWGQPARLTVDRERVRYRSRTIPLAQVSEVALAPNVIIAGRGRRAIELEPGFCAPAALDAVAAEIRRGIVEHGRAGPRALPSTE